ncbi:hypothetical protein OROGR_022299 [Orobanche gracilis]
MPTTFIAVQCFQCSTMQVKQLKKSSNKWICVVCNQNQSVRKVFAQSAMARDVRKIVQSLNMSRQLSDQKQSLSEEIEAFDFPNDSRNTKRIDWSEYVDDQEESYGGKFDRDEDIPEGDNGLGRMVVTEIPKPLFKKPKVKEYSSNGYGSENMFKPIFRNRRDAKRHQNEISQEEHMSLHPSNGAPEWNRSNAQIQYTNTDKPFERKPRKVGTRSSSKWDSYISEECENNNAIGAPMVQLGHAIAAKGPVSKWSSFITKDNEEEENVDDGLEIGRGRDSWDRVGVCQSGSFLLEKLMNDERVEDDIHPDFI